MSGSHCLNSKSEILFLINGDHKIPENYRTVISLLHSITSSYRGCYLIVNAFYLSLSFDSLKEKPLLEGKRERYKIFANINIQIFIVLVI